jgi:hypothetical protein
VGSKFQGHHTQLRRSGSLLDLGQAASDLVRRTKRAVAMQIIWATSGNIKRLMVMSIVRGYQPSGHPLPAFVSPNPGRRPGWLSSRALCEQSLARSAGNSSVKFRAIWVLPHYDEVRLPPVPSDGEFPGRPRIAMPAGGPGSSRVRESPDSGSPALSMMSAAQVGLPVVTDTVGELAAGVVQPELGRDGTYREGKSAVPDALDEFASSIRPFS